MKKITFKRPKESFNHSLSYKIFIGKNKLTELKNGEEKTIEVPTEFENDLIKATIQRWWGSRKIELNSLSENETLNIKGNKFFNKRALFIIVLLPLTGPLMLGYGSENLVFENMGIGLFISFLFFAIGILTIGHNK